MTLLHAQFNSIFLIFLDGLWMDKANISVLVQPIELSLHLIYKNLFSIKQLKFKQTWPEFQSIRSLSNFSI